MNIAYIGGTFDLLHFGHIELFRRVQELGYKVVVSLNEDSFILRYKGSLPIIGFNERAEMLKACKYVDKVVNNVGDEDSKPAILNVMPDVIVHGDDWKGDSLMNQMMLSRTFMETNKINFLYLPYTKGISTTELKRRIKEYE